jgi:CBS domain-containing protein
MWERDCGVVPVVDASGQLVGMLTDRDVCMAAYTRGQPLAAMSVRSTTITGNIGKRWMFGPVNLTIRAGLGYGKYTAKAKEDTQEAKDAEELMNDILQAAYAKTESSPNAQKFAEDLFATCMKTGGNMDPMLGHRS